MDILKYNGKYYVIRRRGDWYTFFKYYERQYVNSEDYVEDFIEFCKEYATDIYEVDIIDFEDL